MSLLIQLLIGSIMIGLTVMMHAISLDFIIRRAGHAEKILRRKISNLRKPVLAALIVVSVFAVHVAQIWMWAFLYMAVGAQPLANFSETLYFATVTYTTLGYGDITLAAPFRMLSAIEGANGFLLFGWTTAFIFEVISQLYKGESKAL